MSEYDRYINLPGFDNVNRALTFLNVPKDIVGNLGDASVDAIVNPDNLPMRERIGRGIESLVGTAAYGSGPLIGKLMGQKAAQAIPETLMGFSGPQAAEEVVKDVVQDPSRRKFIGGVAAAVPVAALAPDLITDVATQVAKKGSRAAINPLDMAMANIRALREQIIEQYNILDDVESAPDALGLNSKAADDAEAFISRSTDQITDEISSILEEMDPQELRQFAATASDDALEELIGVNYTDVRYYNERSPDDYEILIEEARKRGLEKVKNKKGIYQFPYVRAIVEDYENSIFDGDFLDVNPSMQMVRETPDFADDFLKTNEKKINDENIQEIILNGRIDKKSTDEINQNIVRYAEKNNISAPRRVFDNPKVEYVSTQEIADNIAQFNYPRYDVGKFGGDLKDMNLGENPDILKQFEESGKPTLKEDIFNEGIKEPIEIELLLSNGEISIGEGHHRLQAAIELGLSEVPVFIRTRSVRRDGSKSFDTSVAQVKPGRIDTSGINKSTDYEDGDFFYDPTDYSYSELDISNRFISPKETGEEIRRRGGSGYTDPETGEFFDRRRPKYYTPMREGFFRRTDKKAMGGPVEGIASLSDTARDMFRGPRGIGAYQQFAEGGEATARDKVEIESFRNAVMMTESNGDPNAVSPDGAIGLMQIMPPTARDPGFGVENAFEIAERLGYVFNDTSDKTLERLLFLPEVNVEFGNQYLDAMLGQYSEVDDALRAYNAGKGTVDKFIASGRNLNVLTDEAVEYPIKVTAALQGFNPKDMNQMEMFKQSPETAVSLMEDYPAPPVENRMYAAPPVRPNFFPSFAPQQRAVEGIETIQPAVPGVIRGKPKKMYQEPEGIATLTTALRPRPRPSQLN